MADVPAERAAAAVNDLIEAREGAARLRSLIFQQDDHRSPWAELVDGVINRLSSAMSALDVSGAAAGAQSPAAGSSADSARPQQSASSSGNTRKRSFSKRSQGPSDKRVTATLDDGHIWRKYGQKEIQNSPHPRSYYRCTHKSDQGCNAKRHVQLCETDPSKYAVTYYGKHTCRDPSTIPLIVRAAGTAADGSNNLISFEPSFANDGAATSQYAKEGSTSRQQSTSWCTSDDVFSSFMQVDELGAVVGSAAGVTLSTVRLVPDCGGIDGIAGSGGGGTGTRSFVPAVSEQPGLRGGIAWEHQR